MTDSTRVEFTKMQGTGNDFLVLDNRQYGFSREELSRHAPQWCRRRYGVGADGVVALDEATRTDADYRMLYVNADGSTATMCGNGARCLVRFAYEQGFGTSQVCLQTDAGLYKAAIREDQRQNVRLFVSGLSEFQSQPNLECSVPPELHALYYACAGTEHLVVFVENLQSLSVQKWGRTLRHDSLLAPKGANVDFVEKGQNGELRVRTYEKGVEAETLSCGTGVVAAALVAERTGRAAGNPISVHTEGGTLLVGTAANHPEHNRYLEGPAVTVFQGRVQLSPEALGNV